MRDGNVTPTSVTRKYSRDLLLVFNVQQLLPLWALVHVLHVSRCEVRYKFEVRKCKCLTLNACCHVKNSFLATFNYGNCV